MKLVLTNYLIDSHCHIHDTEDFKSTPEEIIARARANNVLQMIVIGTSHQDSLRARDFAAKYDNVFWSYGVHPSEADAQDAERLDFSKGKGDAELRRAVAPDTRDGGLSGRAPTPLLESSRLVAVGEVGLDYHY